MSDYLEQVSALCTGENVRYSELLHTVHGAKNPNTDKPMDIRYYQLPLSQEKQTELLEKAPRMARLLNNEEFYRSVVRNVQRDYNISDMLKRNNIRSTVRFIGSAHDMNRLYLTTEPMTPLSEVGFFYPFEKVDPKDPEGLPVRHPITIGSVIDMGRRILAICIDLNNIGVTHRNINPHCIYFDQDNRLVLGGFDYASLADEEQAPEVPNIHTCHVAPDVKEGGAGSLASDMYSIASIMACFLGGKDICKDMKGAIPELISEDLKETLRLGLSMDDDNVLPFREALNKVWKHNRSFWSWNISALYQMQLTGETTELADDEDELEATVPKKKKVSIPKLNINKKNKEKGKNEKAPRKEKRQDDGAPDRIGKIVSYAMGVMAMGVIVIFVLFMFGIIG